MTLGQYAKLNPTSPVMLFFKTENGEDCGYDILDRVAKVYGTGGHDIWRDGRIVGTVPAKYFKPRKVDSKTVVFDIPCDAEGNPLHEDKRFVVLDSLKVTEEGADEVCCESHPDRAFDRTEETVTATVYDKDGGWPIFVSRSHWTIADDNCRLALCPECSDDLYTFVAEAGDAFFDDATPACEHCGKACEQADFGWVCVSPPCFYYNPQTGERVKA